MIMLYGEEIEIKIYYSRKIVNDDYYYINILMNIWMRLKNMNNNTKLMDLIG